MNPAEAKTARLEASRVRMLGHIKDTFTEDTLDRIVVPRFSPTPLQKRYAMAYVSAAPLATGREVTEAAGVHESSLRAWRKTAGFRMWITQVALAAVGCAVPLVWRVLGELAAGGDKQAAKMILERFDLEWTARKAGHVPPSPDDGIPTEAGLKQERNRLLTTESDSVSGVNGEGSRAPVGKAGALAAEPSTTGQATGSGPEGGGEG